MKGILLFILTSFFCIPGLAQQPNLYFKKINTGNGLSHNKVNCIIQDKRGFIWIGTDDGLNRYDGNNFLVFRNKPGSATGISGNMITGLWEDENEIIWIATADGGLSKYDYRKTAENQFKQFKNIPGNKASIPINIINALIQDENGFLWIATSGKRVLRFNKKTEIFETPVNKGVSTAMALCIDNNKKLWVGRQGGGLLKINTKTLATETDDRYNNLYAKLPHAVVTSLFMDSDKNIWYGSWDKVLYRFNAALQKEEVFQQSALPFSFVNDQIDDFKQDGQKRIWMAGKQNGLHVFDRKLNRFYNYNFNAALEGTIASNNVSCVFIDKNENLWVGTNRGISVSSLQQQFVQQFLPGTVGSSLPVTVYDFFKDKNETLWIGTGNGIYIKKKAEEAIQHIPLSFKGEKIAVTKIFKDDDGTMYLGTNYSLFSYNPSTNRIALLANTDKDKVMNHIIESRIISVIRDTIKGNPVLLTAPYGHFLSYYDLKEKKWISRLDTVMNIVPAFNLVDNLIRKFYRSKDGTIWLAMAKEGLGKWEKSPLPKIKYFKNNPSDTLSISNNNVYDMADDGKRNLWITTHGGGLQHFNTATNQFRHITSSANLLEGLQTDASQHVWMTGSGNLHRYNPVNDSYHSFEMPDIEKSGGITGYIYKDNDGILYTAGANYFIAFNPQTIKENTQSPQVIFTDFKIFNNSYSYLLFQKNISLQYNQNFFTIEFASPHYSGSEKIHYSYMLEGIDKSWIDAGTRNFASYPNAGNGSFIFKVRASVGNGKWTETFSSLKIEIVPPLWKRWWFYVLIALIISATVYGIYRYRVNELLKRQAIRNKIALDLHDSVGSTLSSISVYATVAKIHGEKNEQEDLNTVLEKISGTSNEMVTEMNDIVWAINPRNDSMEKIIQRMESFARPLAAAKNIQFDLQHDPSILSLQLDMDRRKNFYLVFKEAVNNAIKYSGASQLTASIHSDNQRLKLFVKDNGVGFNLETAMSGNNASLAGNGLHNMQKRANELNGKLNIGSRPGTGTTITLELLLN